MSSVSTAVVFHRSNTPPGHLRKSWTLFRVGRNARSISFHSKNTKTNAGRSIQVANSNQKCSHRPWAAPSGARIFSRREIDKSLNWCSSRTKAMAQIEHPPHPRVALLTIIRRYASHCPYCCRLRRPRRGCSSELIDELLGYNVDGFSRSKTRKQSPSNM